MMHEPNPPSAPCRTCPDPFTARKTPVRLILIGLLLTLVLVNPPSSAQETPREGLQFFDTGPLRIREQFLPGQGFLAFEPTSADVLEQGRWQMDLVQNTTNSWAQSEEVTDLLEGREGRGNLTLEDLQGLDSGNRGLYHVDGELHRTSISLRRGLGKGFQASLTIPILDFGGGSSDSLIQGFHDTFSLGQAGRKGVSRGLYRTYFRDQEGREFYRDKAPTAGLGDIALGLKGRLPSPSESWLLALEGQLKLPTGKEEDLYGSGSVDGGLQLLATRYFSRSCLHAGVSLIHQGENRVLHTSDQLLVAAMVGWERAWGESAAILIQGTASQSPFEDLGIDELDEFAFLVDLGFKKGIGNHWVTFLALSENLVNFGSSADVGLHFGITWTSKPENF